jgi:hypothetical protein
MGPESQNILIEIPEQPEAVERAVTAAVRLRTVNRDQTLLAQIWVDELIAVDHKAEASAMDRRQAARQRAARERKERLDAAMDEWKKMAEGCTEKQKETCGSA